MKEIPAVAMPDNSYAMYNMQEDVIYYDRDLEKFPALLGKVLTHERQHKRLGNNILAHIWIDAKDYPRIMITREFHELLDLKRRRLKRLSLLTYAQFPLYVLFQNVYCIVVALVIFIAGGYYRWLKPKR